MHPDTLTSWLKDQGLHPEIYQPGAFLGFPPVGWSLRLRHAHLVYRVCEERPQTLIIVLFERAPSAKGGAGLRGPFFDFVQFLTLVQQSACGICWIEGLVQLPKSRPQDALSSERLDRFYKKYLRAFEIGERNGDWWIAGDLTQFTPPLGAFRSASRESTRGDAGGAR